MSWMSDKSDKSDKSVKSCKSLLPGKKQPLCRARTALTGHVPPRPGTLSTQQGNHITLPTGYITTPGEHITLPAGHITKQGNHKRFD